MKIFLNNKKIPLVPPLHHKNRFIKDFWPITANFLLDLALEPINDYLVTFSAEDIGKIIQGLDPNKAHGHISIRILKICGDTICKPLGIFSQALTSGSFQSEWKKGNIVPIHKKNDKTKLNKLSPFLLTSYLWKNF